MLKIRQTFK